MLPTACQPRAQRRRCRIPPLLALILLVGVFSTVQVLLQLPAHEREEEQLERGVCMRSGSSAATRSLLPKRWHAAAALRLRFSAQQKMLPQRNKPQ